MSCILQRFAGVILALALCLVSGAGGVKAEEVEGDSKPAVDSVGASAATENPAAGIREWLESILVQLDTGEASISLKIEKQTETVYIASIASEVKLPKVMAFCDSLGTRNRSPT